MSGNENRCLFCANLFGSSAKLHWVFDNQLNLLGMIHTSCLAKARPQHHDWLTMRMDWVNYDLEQGRFHAWLFSIPRGDDQDSDLSFARLLAFSDDQQRQLDHWQQGPLHMSAARIPGIMAAYRKLQAEYGELGRQGGWLKEDERNGQVRDLTAAEQAYCDWAEGKSDQELRAMSAESIWRAAWEAGRQSLLAEQQQAHDASIRRMSDLAVRNLARGTEGA